MGMPALAGAWGRYIGFCLGYGHIWPKIKSGLAGKNISRGPFFASKAWDSVDADRGIARVNRATHARAIGTYL
jgi:hypothetical protein